MVSGEIALFENQSVIKTVDLSAAIVKVTLRLSIKPLQETLSEYLIGIPMNEVNHLAYITANNGKNVRMSIKKTEMQNEYRFQRTIMFSDSIQLFVITSKEPFDAKSVIFVEYHLTHVLESLPAFVAQVQFVFIQLLG